MSKKAQQPAKGSKMNLIFAAVVVALAVVLAAAGWLTRLGEPALVAALTYEDDAGAWEMTIPLDEDKTYDVKTLTYTIHVQVRDGAIAFVNSPCPDHTCESFGWLRAEGAWAACAPGEAYLEIKDK